MDFNLQNDINEKQPDDTEDWPDFDMGVPYAHGCDMCVGREYCIGHMYIMKDGVSYRVE